VTNPRKNAYSDSQFVEIIDEITRLGGIDEDGMFVRPVIEKYYNTIYEQRLIEIASLNRPRRKSKPSAKEISAVRKHCASLTAKRWFDTGHRLRGATIIFATDGDPRLRSAFTLWLDPAIVEQARREKKVLSALVRQRLYDRLSRLLGAKQFGFWFHLERTRKDGLDIHIHGVITLADETYFSVRSKRDRLREEIMAAGGNEFKRGKDRALHMKSANLNIGWINYCRKQRPLRRLKQMTHRILPDDIGRPLDAWAGTLKQTTTRFHKRAHVVVNAIISGKIRDWDDATWEKYSAPELSVI
jgi:hypothetical protein